MNFTLRYIGLQVHSDAVKSLRTAGIAHIKLEQDTFFHKIKVSFIRFEHFAAR